MSPAYSAQLQSMIDRAGTLTEAEVDALGKLWESDEQLVMPKMSIAAELQGEFDFPVVTNQALLGVGVRDLISDADYQTLVSPWQQALGPL